MPLAATIRVIAADIKLAHSVFALPFAVLAVFLARNPDEPPRTLALKLGLVVACMVAARTWAMLVNRLADRRLDALNERTRGRALPSGRLSARAAYAAAALAAGAFMGLALGFLAFDNPWPGALAVPVLAWIAFYSFTKRFTAACHFFLGGALAASPIAAAIAVQPASLAETPALWWIAGMVLAWVAGFDVIYALQDEAFDRERGLRSIPAALGARRAALVARGSHAVALACLVAAGLADPRLGTIYGTAVALVAALLIAEHVALVRRGLAGLDLAFFTLNGVISIVLAAAAIADLFL
ncbi:MAG: 4-hydroxybenzoate octaprenyltransferase [Leptolyngbya sp. PLA2]|nr:4-hydroxybenzoate octaprenyltransferase [Leptolyngbya sp.]MCE7971265.1 4-hydroxybenzoate octaprenyltransferase [Leptolyngbya sp. PL-A2]MCQ3939624.1 4-hydroxybenzoate octaprenyltransferase [cyanobacterium CYA1]MCZ7632132.1 putative 4-hydroxybenzoate polyprenyltransferase [Phycisphaerales bacterium]MDL1903880.1 4-hydroxybenzoate octaprenyltransferase [Synechococcales cyanobacterium CNB]GIK18594.1 MAG: 4-hydroxybenzoate octaprenyltransferase [Planctomycetota bacterium]